MSKNTRLPLPVQQQLQAVRGMLRTYVVVQSVLLVLCWLLLLFWLGAMVDYLPVRAGSSETPRWLRMGILAAMGLGSLAILLRWTLPRLLTPIRDRSLALLVERHNPGLNNELVTAVELSAAVDEEFSNPTAHELMMQRVRNSISSKMGGVLPSELFNWQPIWAASTVVIFGLLITAITAFGMYDWLSLWSQRLFTLSDKPWPRSAELRPDGIQLQYPAFTGQLSAQRIMLPFEQELVRIPAGATALLQISAKADTKQVPEVCTMFYRANDGTRGRANLRRVGSPREGWQEFTLDGPPLDGISQDMNLDIIGLDARLRDLQLQVVEPAVVANMQLDCIYPKYLLDELSARPPRELLDYRAGVRIPEGSQITLVGKASSKLRRVEFVVRQSNNASQIDGDEPALVIQSVTPAAVDEQTFRIDLNQIRSSQVVEVRLIDEFGLSSDQIFRYVLTVLEDTPPEVESKLAGIGTAITPRAILPIRGLVSDDHGVQDVTAELALDEMEPIRIPLQLIDDGEIQTDVDLEKLAADGLVLAPKMTLGIVVAARDRFDLDSTAESGPTEHIGTGQPQQLAIVSEDVLLVILDRQELELRQRLELIISELRQVDEVLNQLGLSLASPENAALNRNGAGKMVALQDASDDDDAAADARAQRQRMAVLRAQQSTLQCDKSEQELSGVASRVDNLRLQLLNNRIDSYDRQNRLETKVHQPLTELLAGNYQSLNRALAELQTATMSGQGIEPTKTSLAELSKVLETLESIKANMLDIESFNEIVDIVRTLLEDQEGLLKATEAEQQARILELLKGL